ncbi:DUF2180 family protein [Streptomyces sp. NPDC050161]|uniref:DUF2180 family protein n=1 Tax=Streptomyces sp. NPDC050161 TaxID=3365604 RepID=UPI0037B420E2
MRCFDCAEDGRQATAAALCQQCGAALCHAHTTATQQPVHRAAGMGRAVSPLPARRMICRTCLRAHRAA